MNNVHEREPVLFHTRWVLSYLRGPLTREQIRRLMHGRKSTSPPNRDVPEPPARKHPSSPRPAFDRPAATTRPVLPDDISQAFLPIRQREPGAALVYQPRLAALARIRFQKARLKVDEEQMRSLLMEVPERAAYPDWETVEWLVIDPAALLDAPEMEAGYGKIPATVHRSRNFKVWETKLRAWLASQCVPEIRRNNTPGVVSRPGEEDTAFRIRVREAAREQRDAAIVKLREKYARSALTLDDRLRRARHRLEREAEQARQQKVQTLISVGTTLLGALLGRKAVSRSTLGRATTSARPVGRILKEKEDVARAEETVEVLEGRLQALQARLQAEIRELRQQYEKAVQQFETVAIKPRKSQVQVTFMGLFWVPYWHKGGRIIAAYR